jgi:ribosome maturation factor RimP
MKTFLLSVILAASSLMAADSYTFTSKDGRKLVGDVVSATDDSVTITATTGKQMVVPFTLLVDADVQWVKQWKAKKAAAVASQPKLGASTKTPSAKGKEAMVALMKKVLTTFTFKLRGKTITGSIVDVRGSTITMLTDEGKTLKVNPNDLAGSERAAFVAELNKIAKQGK